MATTESDGASTSMVVLVGAFNPLILEPQWLANNNVISDGDLRYVREHGKFIATSDLTAIELEQFSLQCDRDRLQVATTPETVTPALIGDIVANVFTLLPHTRVMQLGFNHLAHLPMNEEQVSAVLFGLCDPSRLDGLLSEPAVSSVSISGRRQDDLPGSQRLTIEPSVRIQGLYAMLNDHHEIGERGTGAEAAELVSSHWLESLDHAAVVLDGIREQA